MAEVLRQGRRNPLDRLFPADVRRAVEQLDRWEATQARPFRCCGDGSAKQQGDSDA